MGVIAAAFGMALASADQGAATNVAFYAANHVLVKAALFLTVGAVAVLDGRARTLALIVAALARLEPRRIAADRRRARQARGQGPVRRRRRGPGVAAVGRRHHGADADVRHAARALARAERAAASPAAAVVMGGASRRRVARPLAPVSRHRQRGRGARTREALGRDLADAGRRRAGRWSMGRWRSASPHSGRRHCRRRGGRLPRLSVSWAHVRAGRPRLPGVAGGGPRAAH